MLLGVSDTTGALHDGATGATVHAALALAANGSSALPAGVHAGVTLTAEMVAELQSLLAERR